MLYLPGNRTPVFKLLSTTRKGYLLEGNVLFQWNGNTGLHKNHFKKLSETLFDISEMKRTYAFSKKTAFGASNFWPKFLSEPLRPQYQLLRLERTYVRFWSQDHTWGVGNPLLSTQFLGPFPFHETRDHLRNIGVGGGSLNLEMPY